MDKVGISTKIIEPFFETIEKITKVQRILICCTIFLILIGSFVYFSYFPKFKTIDKLQDECKELDKKLAVAKKNASQLEKFREEMRKAHAKYTVAMKALPEKKEIPSLLAGISQSGQDAGLEFEQFNPKAERKKGFYAEIPVSIIIRGHYHNVAMFFDKISRLPRIVNIKDIKMSMEKKGKGKASNTLKTKCTAVTYKFIDEPPPKKKKSKKKSKKKKR